MVQRQFESLKDIDFIGDIHGFADELSVLLQKMGYVLSASGFFHPEGRKVIFVGDYVDRGPKIRETLQIVKTMHDSGNAMALMGNHEYNLLGFFTEKNKGQFYRSHSINKIYQKIETLYAFKHSKKEMEMYLEWMFSLPLFYENEYFRVVHATWNKGLIKNLETLLQGNKFRHLNDFTESYNEENALFAPINTILKGLEFTLPNGIKIEYGDFVKRDSVRIRWWENQFSQRTYRQMSVHQDDFIPDMPITPQDENRFENYSESEKPVFFGHYWMRGDVGLLRSNICCLDFSIAKEHKLVAYRFGGEKILDTKNFVWVNCCEN